MPFLSNATEASEYTGTLDELVQDLSIALGPSGLASDDVDPITIQRLMEKYVFNSAEWSPYALGDSSRAYTRNLIDEGNGKSNLVSQARAVRRYHKLTHAPANPRVESWQRECYS